MGLRIVGGCSSVSWSVHENTVFGGQTNQIDRDFPSNPLTPLACTVLR